MTGAGIGFAEIGVESGGIVGQERRLTGPWMWGLMCLGRIAAALGARW